MQIWMNRLENKLEEKKAISELGNLPQEVAKNLAVMQYYI